MKARCRQILLDTRDSKQDLDCQTLKNSNIEELFILVIKLEETNRKTEVEPFLVHVDKSATHTLTVLQTRICNDFKSWKL